jgi:PAS domain S-box-containing protein
VAGVATYLSFSYFRNSERWITHSQEVRGALGDVESSVSTAARERINYIMSGSAEDLSEYRNTIKLIPNNLKHLLELSQDNPSQVENCRHLEAATEARLEAWEPAIQDKQQGKAVNLKDLLQQNLSLATQSAVVSAAIREEERRLLDQRRHSAQRRFRLATATVVASFLVALALLYAHFKLLAAELEARQKAEAAATDAYRHELALRQERERFKLFVDAVKDHAIYVLDPDGKVATWNQGAERIKGYAASEIIGKHFSTFFTEEDQREGKPQQELQRASETGQFQGEGWRVRKDGSRLWANIALTAIKGADGKLAGFVKVTRDYTERMKAQEKLRQANAELANEVLERLAAQKSLEHSEQALRELSHHLLRTQDEERRRIGRELHDSLGQYLAMLKLSLDSLNSMLPPESADSTEQVDRCVRLAEDCIREVRTISYLLYPPMLEEVGLKSAIQWYLEGFSKRSNIQTKFELKEEFGRLDRDVELALFRVLQESLTNVHRHANSPTAEIRLSKSDGTVMLEVRDDGKGIPSGLLEQTNREWLGSMGVGLRGMNERMRQLGGSLEIASTEKGTRVIACVPAKSQVEFQA